MCAGREFTSHVQKARYWYIANGFTPLGFELSDRCLARYGVEQRHPFCDRRIIEFAYALPQERLCRNRQTKVVLRSAMRNLLPEKVRERNSKAEFSYIFGDAFEAMGGERLFDSLHIATLNLVNGEKVRAMSRELMASYRKDRGGFSSPHMWSLWMVFAVELWFTLVYGVAKDQSSQTGG
jgi:asparagine synthetase B (glutamine-hydrolysing)